MAESSADRDPLDRLAEEFVARFRAGERPSLTEYEERLPDRADEVRDLFPAMVEMEQLKPATDDRTGEYALTGEPTEQAEPTRLGDYRILRRVGQGGMGVVYEAVQESLGRHVALKLLPVDAFLDPKKLERFRREAKSAAKLHHTNIVPVYGTGEAHGRHFYAMQFISGHPLDAVIDEVKRLRGAVPDREPARPVSAVAAGLLTGTFVPATLTASADGPPSDETCHSPVTPEPERPAAPPAVPARGTVVGTTSTPSLSSGGGSSYWTTVARLIAQVADALDYAHRQGVQHRDIKPANLILDLHGTVWVTDFGLAKSADADDLTNTGDVLGTLRYMAPERFEGLGDERADTYALGLTLYELLALRPAFDAASRAKLVELVIAATPPKPRAIDPAIPRDLETVVLKAIARDPADRYQTAGELHDDLQRFAVGEPIRARPVGLVERAYKWAKRNPAAAGLCAAGLAAAVLLVVAVAVGVLWREAVDARGEAEIAKGEAEVARGQAEGEAARADSARGEAERAREKLAAVEYGRSIQAAYREWQEGNADAALLLLEKTRPAFRGWEYRYVHRLCHADLVTIEHRGEWRDTFFSAAWSPDGRSVATSGAATVRVYDATTGVARVEVKKGTQVVCWTPDAAAVVAAGWYAPTLYDARTGNPIGVLTAEQRRQRPTPATPIGQVGSVNLSPLSPDRTQYVSGGTVRDAVTDKITATFAEGFPAEFVKWSPDARLVIGTNTGWDWERTLQVADARTGARLHSVQIDSRSQQIQSDIYEGAGVSRDGRWLAAVGAFDRDTARRVRVWDTATWKRAYDLPPAVSVRWSPDSTRLLTVTPTAVTVYDAATGAVRLKVPAGSPSAASGEWSPDGTRLLIGTFGEKIVRVLDAETGADVLVIRSPDGFHPAWSPDGTRVLTESPYRPGKPNRLVRVWDAVRPPEASTVTAGPPASVLFHFATLTGEWSPDGTRVLTHMWNGVAGPARMWDLRTGRVLCELGPETTQVAAVAWSPDGTRVLVANTSDEGTIWVYDAATGKELAAYRGQKRQVKWVGWSADGERAWSCSYFGGREAEIEKLSDPDKPRIKVWDPRTGADLPPDYPGQIGASFDTPIGWSADRTRVLRLLGSTGAYQAADVYDLKTGVRQPADVRSVMNLPETRVRNGKSTVRAAWSPDETRVLVGLRDGTVGVWDLPSARTVLSVGVLAAEDFPNSELRALAWSPDGRWFAVGASRDGNVKVFDGATGEVVQVLEGHATGIDEIRYSPDGTRILTVGGGIAKLWDARTGAEVFTFRTRTGVKSARWSPDGARVLIDGNNEWQAFDSAPINRAFRPKEVAPPPKTP